MQFCAAPGCGELVEAGRCPRHAPRAAARLSDPTYARAHRWYGSARWQRLRAAVILDEPFCRTCRAAGRRVLTVDVDHIRKHNGIARLFWDRSNLQGLCKACHTAKTSRGE